MPPKKPQETIGDFALGTERLLASACPSAGCRACGGGGQGSGLRGIDTPFHESIPVQGSQDRRRYEMRRHFGQLGVGQEEPPPEILQGDFATPSGDFFLRRNSRKPTACSQRCCQVFPDGSTYSGQYLKKGAIRCSQALSCRDLVGHCWPGESICMHGDGHLQSGPQTFEASTL